MLAYIGTFGCGETGPAVRNTSDLHRRLRVPAAARKIRDPFTRPSHRRVHEKRVSSAVPGSRRRMTAADDCGARVRESFARQTAMATIGAQVAHVAPGEVELRMAHRPELAQQHGYLHAGIVSALADTA